MVAMQLSWFTKVMRLKKTLSFSIKIIVRKARISCGPSRTSAPGSPTCAAASPTRRRRWPRCSAAPATRPSWSASGTCARWTRPRPPGPTTTGRSSAGFDRFYGFLDGETDQFTPDLTYDNHSVEPPRTPEEGYHLTEDLVDKTPRVHQRLGVDPPRPAVLHLPRARRHPRARTRRRPSTSSATGAATTKGGTSPASAWFARQKELGLIPPDTELAPRNPGVDAWDDMPDAHRRLAARLQEAFAAFLEHTDDQIGRLVDALERHGPARRHRDRPALRQRRQPGGRPFGVLHEMKFFNFLFETPEEAVDRLDDIGGPNSHANYPWGWAQAGNTPFKWYKQNTHEGGCHVPCIVHWPKGIDDRGAIRDQFHYVTDIAPTIYELVGVEAPDTYRGIPQLPVTGTSMAYTFDAASADPPAATRSQYFEMMGHRAMYVDGWKAVTRPPGRHVVRRRHVGALRPHHRPFRVQRPGGRAPREAGRADRALVGRGRDARRAAPRRPHRRALRRPLRRPHPAPARPPLHLPAADVVPPRPRRRPASAAAAGTLTATVDRAAGDGGVLYALGNGNAGLSVFVQDDRLVFDYNAFGDHTVVESDGPCPVGTETASACGSAAVTATAPPPPSSSTTTAGRPRSRSP